LNQIAFIAAPQAQVQTGCLLGLLRPVLQRPPAKITIKTATPFALDNGPQIGKSEPPVEQAMEVLILIGLEAFVAALLTGPGVFSLTPVASFLPQASLNVSQDRWIALARFTEIAAEPGAIDMGIDNLEQW
jgi:hypothetical protein